MFTFKQFGIDDSACAMKVGTDGVLLGRWTHVEDVCNIVDAGCGSGLISLMMAQRSDVSRIFAIDIDPSAIKCCQSNVDASPWPSRIEVIQNDITEAFPERASSPLLIISNPPFFNEPLKSPDGGRALARHGESFGIGALIEIASYRLQGNRDSLAFISPAGRRDEIEWLLSCARLMPKHVTTVYSKEGKNALRILWQVIPEKFVDGPCMTDTLCIRNRDNEYSVEYQQLTSPFYLDK